MPPLTLATAVHDKDTKSSKKESKLRQCHLRLWNGLGNIGVVIVNPILPEILCIPSRLGFFGPMTTNVWKASISESLRGMAIADEVLGHREKASTSNHHAMSPLRAVQTPLRSGLWQMGTHLAGGYPLLCTDKSKRRHLRPSWSPQRHLERTPFCDCSVFLDLLNFQDIALSLAVRSPDSFRIVIYLLDTKKIIGSKEEVGRFSLFFWPKWTRFKGESWRRRQIRGNNDEKVKAKQQAKWTRVNGEYCNPKHVFEGTTTAREPQGKGETEKPTTDGGGGKSAGHDTMDRGKMRFKIVVAENGYLQITCTYLI